MTDETKALIEAEKGKAELSKLNFDKKEITETPNKSIANELIDYSLGEAVKHKITNDDNVKGRLLNTADKVIDNAMNVAESEADTADKKAFFDNKKGACECWGYSESTTNKKFVKVMAFIFDIFTAIWIAIGAVTFAPIVFVAKKIQVIVKKTWVAVIFAILIYLAVILAPTLTAILKK